VQFFTHCNNKSSTKGLSTDGNIVEAGNIADLCVPLLRLSFQDNGGCILSPSNPDFRCTDRYDEDLAGETNLVHGMRTLIKLISFGAGMFVLHLDCEAGPNKVKLDVVHSVRLSNVTSFYGPERRIGATKTYEL